jgi:excisionase family DNA binding protein
MKSLLTAKELATALSLSVDTVWRYTRQERIPAVDLGGKQYRYDKEAVLAALTARDRAASKESTIYSSDSGYTYEDYLKIPDQPGYRFEVLEGTLAREPSPTIRHQRICRELALALISYFDTVDPDGEVFFAPLDVTLTAVNVLQPDILYVSGARKSIVLEDHIDGPCDLVVEIMSPTNRRKDRLQKMSIYGKAGIPHYWLVDPEEDTLEAFVLKGGTYALAVAVDPEQEFAHPDFPGLALNLRKVFHMSK